MKRRLNYFITLLLICIIFISSTFFVSAENESTKNQYASRMESQIIAVEAYQNMMQVFDPNGVYDFNFPEEYSGAYISDNNHLVICLTEINADYIEKYQKMCKNDKIIDFKVVKYSYIELKELTNAIYEISNEESISSISISAKDNNICIGLDSNDLDNKTSVIKAKVLKSKKFNLKGASLLPIVSEYREKAKETVNLIGGYALKNSSGASFSLGVCGTYNGSASFFTCGHAFSQVGENVYNSSGTKIGTVSVKQFTNGSYFDYAIVKITDTTNFTTTNKVYGSGGATVSINGVSTYPVEGTIVYKYGQAGGYAYGQVSASDTSVAYDSGNVIWGLTKVTLTQGTISSGDSGGPCYFNNKISGVISGKSGSNIFYYSPLLTGGFTVKTS